MFHVRNDVGLYGDKGLNDHVFNALKDLDEIDAHLLVFCSQLLEAPLRGVVGLVKVQRIQVRVLIRHIV